MRIAFPVIRVGKVCVSMFGLVKEEASDFLKRFVFKVVERKDVKCHLVLLQSGEASSVADFLVKV